MDVVECCCSGLTVDVLTCSVKGSYSDVEYPHPGPNAAHGMSHGCMLRLIPSTPARRPQPSLFRTPQQASDSAILRKVLFVYTITSSAFLVLRLMSDESEKVACIHLLYLKASIPSLERPKAPRDIRD